LGQDNSSFGTKIFATKRNVLFRNTSKIMYMKNLLKVNNGSLWMILFSSIMYVNSVVAQTDIPEGNVNGTWALANSPYQINGEITIPNGDSLIIEPGVEVLFTGHYKFNVQGMLKAVGTPVDTITFTAQDTITGWHGIRFMSTANTNDTSEISYCKLQYGKATTGSYYDQSGGAIMVMSFSKLIISNCLIHFNSNSGDPDYTGGGAICFWNASPVLTNCSIIYNNGNTGGAIICWSNANPIVSNNIIAHNRSLDGAAFYIGNASNPVIKNNLIINNHATDNCGGVRCYQNSKPLIINNVIVNNHASYGGAIDCRDHANPIIINSILYSNSAGTGSEVFIDGADSDPSFLFCDIEGGKDGFQGTGAGNSYNGIYANNIDSDPLFGDTIQGDFHLSDESPCISTGVDSVLIGTIWYFAPKSDFDGNPRPAPMGTTPDMGAFENPKGYYNPVTALKEILQPDENGVQLFQNYPNPFSSITTIAFKIPVRQMVSLKMFDFQGREVASLVNEVKQPGECSVYFDATKLREGIYSYQLSVEGYFQTRKCIIVR
jgi:hypothetical protein